MVAWLVAVRIEERRDTALLGRPVSEATKDDKADLSAPLGTGIATGGRIILGSTVPAILPPITDVGTSFGSALSRLVAAMPRHRASVHVVRSPFAPLTTTGAIRVVWLGAAVACANDKVARLLDPRTDVGKRAGLTLSRLVAAWFKQLTSKHVVVVRPLEAVIVIG